MSPFCHVFCFTESGPVIFSELPRFCYAQGAGCRMMDEEYAYLKKKHLSSIDTVPVWNAVLVFIEKMHNYRYRTFVTSGSIYKFYKQKKDTCKKVSKMNIAAASIHF
jgi:hypothetical protein